MEKLATYIKFNNGSIVKKEYPGTPRELVIQRSAGHLLIKEVNAPAHLIALPTSFKGGIPEIAQFEGKVTDININESMFTYGNCTSCGGQPPSPQGHDHAISCGYCNSSIAGAELSKREDKKEVLLLQPEYEPIEPLYKYKNVDRKETLELDNQIKEENNRNALGCFSWLIGLSGLSAGAILINSKIESIISHISDIHYTYNDRGYYIPAKGISETLDFSGLLCLAPLAVMAIVALVNFARKNQTEVDQQLVQLLEYTPEDLNSLKIYQLTDKEYNDPAVLVRLNGQK